MEIAHVFPRGVVLTNILLAAISRLYSCASSAALTNRVIPRRELTGRSLRSPLWSFDELDPCFVVPDENGQKLAYVYFKTNRAGDQRPSAVSSGKLPAQEG